MSRVYSAIDSSTIASAKTAMQLTAPSTMNVQILRVWVEQNSSTTSAMSEVKLTRKSAGVTGGATITPAKFAPGDPASSCSVLGNSTSISAEGTNGDNLIQEAFNILNGWLWIPTPDERPWIAPSGIIAITFTVATSATYRYGIVFEENG